MNVCVDIEVFDKSAMAAQSTVPVKSFAVPGIDSSRGRLGHAE